MNNIKDIYTNFNFSKDYKNKLIKFLKNNTTVESGGNKLFDGSYNTLLHIPDELAELIIYLKKACKKKKINNFLEIGFSHGICNTILNKFFNFKTNVSIDTFGPHINGNVLLANMRFKNLTLFCGNSNNKLIINGIKKFEKFDLIFIDGSHEYDYVKKDFESYFPMLNSKGLIIFHDINIKDSGSKKFWNEIKRKFKKKKIKEIIVKKYKFSFGYGILEF
tara:strand:- start:1888 stop:2547 length:660 start_codon:yes stop_codon:yes gene_type:complete